MERVAVHEESGDCVMNREKVIKSVDICRGNGHCEDCQYYQGHAGYTIMDCRKYLLNDALALLKEQEAKPVDEHGRMFSIRYGSCPNCLKPIDSDVNPKACGNCGQAVKWE